MGHKDWKRIDREVVYQANTADEISFIRDRIKLSSGKEFDYVFVDCPYEVVYVVGLDDNENILLIKQYRYLLENTIIEVPAGSPEADESLEAGAAREFEEETGFIANSIIKLNDFFPSTGITNQVCHIFLATDLVQSETNLEESEFIEIEWKPIADAVAMVYENKIQNVGAAYGILLAYNWLQKES